MEASANGVRLIKHYEKLCLVGYLCPRGIWTIGWGSTGRVNGPQRIDSVQADEWFHEDLTKFVHGLNHMIRRPVKQCEFDALVSWAFNVGLEAARTSTLIRILNAGDDRKEVAAELLKWRWITVDGKKKSLKGLTARREAERQLFLTGQLNWEASPKGPGRGKS